MRLDEALARLTYALATADEERAAAIRAILRQGAGVLGLPAGAVLSDPGGLVPERREAWASLAEALRIDTVGVAGEWRTDAEWTPTRTGQWESVLATLLIERDWERIGGAAAALLERAPGTPECPV